MEFLEYLITASFLGKAVWIWLLFLLVVVALLSFDLGVLHRDRHEIGVRESLCLSAGYIAAAGAFGAWVWWYMGAEAAVTYFTGYLIEKSLSLDNVFVIALIFSYFAVPREYQHRVLFWGVLGVVVLRGIMIALGATLVAEFDWILWFFGAFLLFSGVRMLFASGHAPDLDQNRLLRFLRRRLRVTDDFAGGRFWVRRPDPETGRAVLWATPLLLALCVVEFADVVFAVDSVPAVFSVTTDPYIVYTSNIFAILGLRALYFALSAMIHRFSDLKYALSLVLIFIGGKIFWVQLRGKVDPAISLGVTFVLLAGGVIVSLVRSRAGGRAADTGSDRDIP